MRPPNDLVIRLASPADADAVLRLARDFAISFTVDDQRFRQTFDELLSDRSTCVRVAALDGVVVGYVLAFEHLTFFANGRVAWVEEIAVAEPHRRKGVGASLM